MHYNDLKSTAHDFQDWWKNVQLKFHPLCILFNGLWAGGCFPNMWKYADMVPEHKSEDKENVENVWGISLLCTVSKVLERCVYRHMFIFFRPSLYHLQDGFVKGRSTVTSLLKTTHCFVEALDNRRQIDAIYLDFSKAFDSCGVC